MTAPDPAAVEALAEAMHAAHYRRTCLGGTSVEPGRGCIETRDLAEAALAAIARGEVPGVTLVAQQSGIPREAVEALRAAFSGDEFEENARGAAAEDEWSWFRWLAVSTVEGLAAHPATDQPEVD